ncbi:MAG: hypothetical protein KC496_17340, partial [Anaerolineae bacterium]|nr:hypothetical protein [Anaerolineae bacterium]
YEYDAFGNLQGDPTLETSYLYTGQQFDPLTELYSLRARYYDPTLGRFLSQDTYPYDYHNRKAVAPCVRHQDVVVCVPF